VPSNAGTTGPVLLPDASAQVTLARCVELAFANNASVIDAGQGIRIAELAVDLAIASVLPRVTAGADLATRNQSNNISQNGIIVNTGPRDTQTLSTTFQIPVYDFGGSRAILKQSHIEVERARLRVAMTKLQLVAVVEQAFNSIVSIDAQMHALDGLVESLTRQAADARARFANGVATEDAVLLIEHTLRDAQWRREEAMRMRVQAEWRLASVCGLPHDVAWDLDTTLPDAAVAVPDFLTLFAHALERRPDALDLALEAQQLGLRRDVLDAEYWPKLAVTGGLISSSNDRLESQTWLEMTFSARWTLYSGNDTASRVEGWEIQRDQMERREQDFQRRLALDIAVARDSVLLAADRLALRRAGVAPAERHRDLVESRFNAGTGTASELAEANRLLALARVDADFAKLALASAQMQLETVCASPLLTPFFDVSTQPPRTAAATDASAKESH
jgi:outer membrane protein TolC